MKNKWHFLDTDLVDPEFFGLFKLFAVKVKKHDYDCDVRTLIFSGWITLTELLDRCPISGKTLEKSEWFIFAAQGEEIVL